MPQLIDRVDQWVQVEYVCFMCSRCDYDHLHSIVLFLLTGYFESQGTKKSICCHLQFNLPCHWECSHEVHWFTLEREYEDMIGIATQSLNVEMYTIRDDSLVTSWGMKLRMTLMVAHVFTWNTWCSCLPSPHSMGPNVATPALFTRQNNCSPVLSVCILIVSFTDSISSSFSMFNWRTCICRKKEKNSELAFIDTLYSHLARVLRFTSQSNTLSWSRVKATGENSEAIITQFNRCLVTETSITACKGGGIIFDHLHLEMHSHLWWGHICRLVTACLMKMSSTERESSPMKTRDTHMMLCRWTIRRNCWIQE